jgi:hypothetical protein
MNEHQNMMKRPSSPRLYFGGFLGSGLDPMIPSMSGDPIHAQSLASFFKFILRIFEK